MYKIITDKDFSLTPEIFCDICNKNTVQKVMSIGNQGTTICSCGNTTKWLENGNDGQDL